MPLFCFHLGRKSRAIPAQIKKRLERNNCHLVGLFSIFIQITSIFVGKMTETNEQATTRFGGNKRPDKKEWSDGI